ncbi:MAG TPA: YkgJ family cysteine cluster protein [Planctomycetota bacterium]|nr:YkgJ family cysteine cluster protein [Planctomycetota bacterium]
MLHESPCTACGACCAYFRASFYWSEAEPSAGGTVPSHMVTKVNDFLVAMRGTDQPKPRCIALDGTIGSCVRCTIYEDRSSVCRDFPYAYQYGEPSEGCDKARAAHGLPPIAPPGTTETVTTDHDLPRAS